MAGYEESSIICGAGKIQHGRRAGWDEVVEIMHPAAVVEEGVRSPVSDGRGPHDLPRRVDAVGEAGRPAERAEVADTVHGSSRGRPSSESENEQQWCPMAEISFRTP